MNVKTDMKIINQGNLIAVGNVTIDGIFTIHQVKYLKSKEDPSTGYVALPRRKQGETWIPVFQFQNEEVRQEFDLAVKKGVQEVLLEDMGDLNLAVDVFLCKGGGPVKAVVNFNYQDLIQVKGIRVMEQEGREWIAMPSTETSEKESRGSYMALFSAHTIYAGERIKDEILAAYHEKVEQTEPERSEKPDKDIPERSRR